MGLKIHRVLSYALLGRELLEVGEGSVSSILQGENYAEVRKFHVALVKGRLYHTGQDTLRQHCLQWPL